MEAGKSETSEEQERIHSLIAMLETELKTQQSAYDTIKGGSLQRIQEYRNQLQPAKKKFFSEQQKTARDREQEESCRKMQIEAKELKLSKRHQKLSSADYGTYSFSEGSDVVLLIFTSS